ncbi:MAG: hypothetical protein JWM80_5342 [Cyanobacteria bacterium RYN_339]|nr:hypothetical protein [Cyanobacteria bacterium RYN_339]
MNLTIDTPRFDYIGLQGAYNPNNVEDKGNSSSTKDGTRPRDKNACAGNTRSSNLSL